MWDTGSATVQDHSTVYEVEVCDGEHVSISACDGEHSEHADSFFNVLDADGHTVAYNDDSSCGLLSHLSEDVNLGNPGCMTFTFVAGCYG